MKVKVTALRTAIAIAALAAAPALSQLNPAARYAPVSPPDCAGPSNLISEGAQEPVNETHMRIQHMGDPGSDELSNEIARVVTWDVSAVTGLRVPVAGQRGYRDEPGANAFQFWCGNVGFFINSNGFSHSSPLFGEGPSATMGRLLDPAPAAFVDPQSTLLIEANVAVPYLRSQALTATLGIGQVSFLYYVRDVTSGTIFAHVIALFDNRPFGLGGAGVESLGNDGITAFASSPLLEIDATGAPVRFVEVSPLSATARFGETWSEKRFFRAQLPYAKFKAMLERIKRDAIPAMSAEPMDYRVLFFGGGGEISAGTGPDNNVQLGASISDLALYRITARGRFRHSIEQSR